MKSRPASLALVAALVAGAVGVSSVAQAQSTPPPPAGAPAVPPQVCAQHEDHTGATVVGGLAGAALGSNLAAHHGGRVGGAIIGGLLGAIVGHRIGEENSPPPAGCYGYYRAAPAPAYAYYRPYYHHFYAYPHYYRPYPYYVTPAYVVAAPPPPPPGYAPPPDAIPAPAGECKTTSSEVRMPDGSTEQRDVRVCKDGSGRYRVVD
jgi:hypothetical protein